MRIQGWGKLVLGVCLAALVGCDGDGSTSGSASTGGVTTITTFDNFYVGTITSLSPTIQFQADASDVFTVGDPTGSTTSSDPGTTEGSDPQYYDGDDSTVVVLMPESFEDTPPATESFDGDLLPDVLVLGDPGSEFDGPTLFLFNPLADPPTGGVTLDAVATPEPVTAVSLGLAAAALALRLSGRGSRRR